MAEKKTQNIAAQNRRAFHDYVIEDTLEAGIMLKGSEVKSLRLGRASIQEAFATEVNGELFLLNAYIPEYKFAHGFNHEPKRQRKLLVKRRELNKLLGLIKQKGITLVPISIYFTKRGIAKVKIGLGKGKQKADKRQSEKERDWSRQKSRLMREKN